MIENSRALGREFSIIIVINIKNLIIIIVIKFRSTVASLSVLPVCPKMHCVRADLDSAAGPAAARRIWHGAALS